MSSKEKLSSDDENATPPATSENGFQEAAKPHYLGHRERLRKRFREGGAGSLPDYELLELVLFRAMPRRDTKPLAKAILARFGTFAEAMNAPEDRLLEVPGLGDAAVTEIKLVRAAALRLMRGLTAPVFYFGETVKTIGEEDEDFGIDVPVPHAFIQSVLAEDAKGKLALWTFEMKNQKLMGDLRDYLVKTYDAEQIVGGRFWDRISGGDLHEQKQTAGRMWDLSGV